MTERAGTRPGGRSARVQEAVHQAVKTLEASGSREALTVPRIAAQAGVTPSTIYRRWGDLAELLADVSVARLHLDGEPPDTGSLAGDLRAWGEPYLEEMVSAPGQRALNDIMASADLERRHYCYRCGESVMALLVARAVARGETAPSVDALIDGVIAPMTYRLLYDREAATAENLQRWIADALRLERQR